MCPCLSTWHLNTSSSTLNRRNVWHLPFTANLRPTTCLTSCSTYWEYIPDISILRAALSMSITSSRTRACYKTDGNIRECLVNVQMCKCENVQMLGECANAWWMCKCENVQMCKLSPLLAESISALYYSHIPTHFPSICTFSHLHIYYAFAHF